MLRVPAHTVESHMEVINVSLSLWLGPWIMTESPLPLAGESSGQRCYYSAMAVGLILVGVYAINLVRVPPTWAIIWRHSG